MQVLADLLYKIWCAILAIGCYVRTGTLWVVNEVLRGIAAAVNAAISVLPDMAMPNMSVDSGLVANLNYFFPLVECVTLIIAIFGAWVAYKALMATLFFWRPF